MVPLGDQPAFARALAATLDGTGPAGAVEPPDRDVWAEWDPVLVGRHYRRRYEHDLGIERGDSVNGLLRR